MLSAVLSFPCLLRYFPGFLLKSYNNVTDLELWWFTHFFHFFFNLSTDIILLDWQEEDYGAGYVVQPVGQTEEGDAGGSVMEPGNEDDDAEEKEEVEDDDNDVDVRVLPPTSSSQLKRKRNGIADKDDNGEDDEEEDDVVDCSKSTKKHR